jgi:uncharacterized membrane protein
MDSGDRSQSAESEIEVRWLLRELDELHELDQRRRQEPRGSAAYTQAVREVDRRSRALIDRLRARPASGHPSDLNRSGGQLA